MKLSLPTRPRQKLPVAAGALMLWGAISPWLWGYAGSGSAVANHIFIMFALGPLAFLIVVLRPAAFMILAAGLWIALSPWLLGYATNHTAWLSELATGVLLGIVGARAAEINIRARSSRRGRGRGVAGAPAIAEAAAPYSERSSERSHV